MIEMETALAWAVSRIPGLAVAPQSDGSVTVTHGGTLFAVATPGHHGVALAMVVGGNEPPIKLHLSVAQADGTAMCATLSGDQVLGLFDAVAHLTRLLAEHHVPMEYLPNGATSHVGAS